MLNFYSHKYMTLKKQMLEECLAKNITQQVAGNRLCVSRQTISKWVSRYKRFGEEGLSPQKRSKRRPPTKNKTSQKIEDIIIEYAERCWNDGVQSLSDRLSAEKEIHINPSTIYRILKRKKIRYFSYWTGTRKRTKKKLYYHKEAGKEMQMDTKYPFGYKAGKVVYTAIDDASRWVFAHVYKTANAENSKDFIKKLISIAPFNIQKIRTDCGTEFVNKKVTDALDSYDIDHRRNTPYCPEENGKIERFHGTLNQKAIQYYWHPSDSLEELEYKLKLFLQYYNYKKRHKGLGMNGLTPMQKLNFLAFSGLKNVKLTLQCDKIISKESSMNNGG
jgi:transposase InsO family protein